MTKTYKVLDLRPDAVVIEHIVKATTPESAAETALGLEVVRSGLAPRLVGRVYWQGDDENQSMVRVYRKLEDHERSLGRGPR